MCCVSDGLLNESAKWHDAKIVNDSCQLPDCVRTFNITTSISCEMHKIYGNEYICSENSNPYHEFLLLFKIYKVYKMMACR